MYKDLDHIWGELIGSSEIVLYEEATCRCLNYNAFGDLEVTWSGSCLDNPDPNPWLNCAEYTSWWSVDFTKRESDAFILVESAMNGPGMNYTPRKMDGSNHLQMKNDSNTKLAIEAIFENGLGGDYFYTDKREE